MLRRVKDREDHAIRAADGVVGRVKDLHFDDEAGVIRYFAVDAGGWLSNRKVQIAPIATDHPDWAKQALPVSITNEQVTNSPLIDTAKPVSRQREMRDIGYCGYPAYWGSAAHSRAVRRRRVPGHDADRLRRLSCGAVSRRSKSAGGLRTSRRGAVSGRRPPSAQVARRSWPITSRRAMATSATCRTRSSMSRHQVPSHQYLYIRLFLSDCRDVALLGNSPAIACASRLAAATQEHPRG